MRLLDVRQYINSNRLRMNVFSDDDIPKYAILSHTWTKVEATFELVHKNPYLALNGPYRKVNYAIEQAYRDQLDYIWIDTCCIDKSSSQELSEAINSMFRWYQQAEICYAYLEDLSPRCPSLIELASERPLEYGVGDGQSIKELESIRDREVFQYKETQNDATIADSYWTDQLYKCRWFTRGWTLQELIAPGKVCFFGTSWNFIGSRVDIVCTLEKITGISGTVLKNGYQPQQQQVSIAKRLSWAARRNTTRVEDKAYSLLGLLGINMGLLYGEGENAFIRLQKEVMRANPDCSILCWERYQGAGAFADAPKRFRTCSQVVTCDINDPTIFEPTNRGLSLILPLLETSQDGGPKKNLALLACRTEADLERLIALHLACHKKERVLGQESLVCSIEPCRVSCKGRQNGNHVVGQDKLPDAESLRVIVLADGYKVNNKERNWHDNSILFKTSSSLEIITGVPARQWNQETLTITKHRSLAAVEDPCTAVIHLLHQPSDVGVAVCVGLYQGRKFIKINGLCGRTVEEIHSEFHEAMKYNRKSQTITRYTIRSAGKDGDRNIDGTMQDARSMSEDVQLVQLYEAR